MTFLTTTADQEAAFTDPGTKVAARVSIDFTNTGTLVEIPSETVLSVSIDDKLETDTAGAVVSTATIKLDNEQLWYSPLRFATYSTINRDYNGAVQGDGLGNLRPGRLVKIEVNPDGAGWVTRFEGFVDDRGFQEKIFTGTRNEVTIRCEDLFARLKYVETAPDGGDTRVYTSVKVFDASDQSNSLVHILADLAGISGSAVSGETISHVIDYAPLTKSVAEELAKLAEAWEATFTVVNGILYFTDSRYADGYVESTTPEFTFDNDVYSDINGTINRAEVKNEVESSYDHYTFLEKQPLWQFSEGLNADTGKTNYSIPAGDVTRNITDPDVTYQAKYSIPINNEPYSVIYAQNIDTSATVLANAEITGGTVTFAEYDVSTYGDRAIIRLAVSGSTAVIKKLVIEGEGLVNTRVNRHLERNTGSVDAIGARRLKIQNKFLTESDVAGYPHYASWSKWHLDYYSVPRFKFTVKTDRPMFHATVGSLVRIQENLNGTSINKLCKIIGIKASVSGDKNSVTFQVKEIMTGWAGTPSAVTNVDQTTFEAAASGATAAAQAAYGLNEYGQVQLPVSNNNILEEIQTGALSGLYFDQSRFGYFTGTEWNTFFDSAGDARIGIAGGNRIDWVQSTGALSVHGDIFLSGDSIIRGTLDVGDTLTVAGDINVTGVGSIYGTGYSLSASALTMTAGSIDINAGAFVVTSSGAVTATDLTITGGSIDLGPGVFQVDNAGNVTATSLNADGGTLANLTVDGTLTVGAGGSITGTGYTLDDSGGTISGWSIGATALSSPSDKVILDEGNNRIEIQDGLGNTKVAIGYLGSIGTWTATDYGVYIAPGNNLVVEGGGDWKDGDYNIQSDAAFVIENGVGTELGRFGSLGAGEVGLRIPDGVVEIGDVSGAGNSLEWDGTNLTIVGGGTFSGALSAATGTFTGSMTVNAGTSGLGLDVEVELSNGFLNFNDVGTYSQDGVGYISATRNAASLDDSYMWIGSTKGIILIREYGVYSYNLTWNGFSLFPSGSSSDPGLGGYSARFGEGHFGRIYADGHVVPLANNTYDLGGDHGAYATGEFYWRSIYGYSLNTDSLGSISGSGISVQEDLLPSGVYDLGSSAAAWAEVHANAVTVGGLLTRDSTDRSGLLEIVENGTQSYTGFQITRGNGSHWSLMGDDTGVGLYDDKNESTFFWCAEGGDIVSYRNFEPHLDATYNLGDPSYAWNNVYATTYYQGGDELLDSALGYIKYADGTLICYKSNLNDGDNWVFPQTFYTTPSIQFQVINVNDGGSADPAAYSVYTDTSPSTTSSGNLRVKKVTKTDIVDDAAATVHGIAIGRWKA